MENNHKACKGGYREIIDDLCRDDTDGRAVSRRAWLGSGYLEILSQAITSGTFFTALLIAMGAGEAYIGYVTLVTTLCMAVQFVAPLFWERRCKRKKLILRMGIIGDFLSYVGLPLTAVLPVDMRWKLFVYMVLTLASGVIKQFCLPARNSWMLQCFPLSKRVSYSSLTSMVHTVINVVSVFLAGLLVDEIEGSFPGFGTLTPTLFAIFVVRGMAFIMSLVSTVWRAYRVKEAPYSMLKDGAVHISALIEPMRNKSFFCIILIPCLWAMIGGIIGNYFTMHLIENVKMSYTVISSVGFISTPMILLITPIWTRIVKGHDWVGTMIWAIVGYCMAYCCNVLISAETQYFYFIAIVVGHLFSPGITIVSNNLLYVHMPEENRTSYFAFYSLMTTAFTLLGQAFGIWLVTATESVRLTIFGITVCNLQLTSAVAAFFGIMLAVTVLVVKRRSALLNINGDSH